MTWDRGGEVLTRGNLEWGREERGLEIAFLEIFFMEHRCSIS